MHCCQWLPFCFYCRYQCLNFMVHFWICFEHVCRRFYNLVDEYLCGGCSKCKYPCGTHCINKFTWRNVVDFDVLRCCCQPVLVGRYVVVTSHSLWMPLHAVYQFLVSKNTMLSSQSLAFHHKNKPTKKLYIYINKKFKFLHVVSGGSAAQHKLLRWIYKI